MESMVKADIFFFVTTICVFVITALLVMILLHVLRITKTIREILDKAKGEADGLVNDIAAFRASLHAVFQEGHFGLKPFLESLKKKKAEVVKTTRARVRKMKKTAAGIVEDAINGINH